MTATAEGAHTQACDVAAVLARGCAFDERDASLIHRHYFDALGRYADTRGAPDPEGAANLALFDACRAHARHPITDEAAFRTYLYKAVRNHTLNQLRRNEPATTEIDEHHLVERPADNEIVDRYWLGDLLDQLPADQRRVLDLRVVHGLSADEVGEVLDRKPNAVYQLQHRAQKQLLRLVLGALAASAVVVGGISLLRADRSERLTSEPVQLPEGTDPTTPPSTGTTIGDALIVEPTITTVDRSDGEEVEVSEESVTASSTGEPTPAPSTSAESEVPASSADEPTTTTTQVSPSGAHAAPVFSFNTCRVVANNSHSWVELYDVDASGSKPGPLTPPARIRLTVTDETGPASVIEVQPGLPKQPAHGWFTDDGTWTADWQADTSWGVKLGSLRIRLLGVEVLDGADWRPYTGCATA